MRRLPLILLLLTAIGVAGCRRVPKYVMKPGELAELMADMYVGEAMSEQNHNLFYSDSSRLMLKQSILQRHGVDIATFDTTMMWYGNNMDMYVDVCDRTIKILEDRNRAAGTAVTTSYLSMAGDSVDVWMGERYGALTRRLPLRAITFEMDSDENWQSGDIYTWRFKLVDNIEAKVHWDIVVDYADSTMDAINQITTYTGWNTMMFPTDSTRIPVRMRGTAEIIPDDSHMDVWVDSIELTRRRVNPQFYSNRHRVRHFTPLR